MDTSRARRDAIPYRRVVRFHGRAQPRVDRREEVHPRAGAVRVLRAAAAAAAAAGCNGRFVGTCHHRGITIAVALVVRIVVYRSQARSAPPYRPPCSWKPLGPGAVADPVAFGRGVAGSSLPLERFFSSLARVGMRAEKRAWEIKQLCCAIGVERCGEFAASTAVVVHRLQRRTQSGAVRAGQLYETFTKRRWMFFEDRHRTRERAESANCMGSTGLRRRISVWCSA